MVPLLSAGTRLTSGLVTEARGHRRAVCSQKLAAKCPEGGATGGGISDSLVPLFLSFARRCLRRCLNQSYMLVRTRVSIKHRRAADALFS